MKIDPLALQHQALLDSAIGRQVAMSEELAQALEAESEAEQIDALAACAERLGGNTDFQKVVGELQLVAEGLEEAVLSGGMKAEDYRYYTGAIHAYRFLLQLPQMWRAAQEDQEKAAAEAAADDNQERPYDGGTFPLE